MSSRSAANPSKRAVAERLASLRKRRAGLARHVARLQAFPLAELLSYERGQLKYFQSQIASIDLIIQGLTE